MIACGRHGEGKSKHGKADIKSEECKEEEKIMGPVRTTPHALLRCWYDIPMIP